MPLLDHFHPPLSRRRHWDSFHGAWAEAIAKRLNQDLLPDRFYAEARVKLGNQVEIDVGTFADNGRTEPEHGAVALWAPPQALIAVPLDFQDPDLFEIQVLADEEGPRVVAAIELVSPANKDRPGNRRAFAVKCASYLQSGVAVMVVDDVTERRASLHSELLRLLNVQAATPGQQAEDLYATAYRTKSSDSTLLLEVWAEALSLGGILPTLPLWISSEQSVPVDLEETYQSACEARRIG